MKIQRTFPKGADYNHLFDFLDDAITGYCEFATISGTEELTEEITITIETKEEKK